MKLRALCILIALGATVLRANTVELWPLTFDLTPQAPAHAYGDKIGSGYELGTETHAADAPYLFSIKLPEGNYRLTLTLGGSDLGQTTIKVESRRLLLASLTTQPGETLTRSFFVNVRNTNIPPPEHNAPGGSAVLINDRERGSFTWDDKLTLEVNGPHPRVRSMSITPAAMTTVFLLGDSTVCDQRWEDGASWGQMLPRFLPGVVIANHAEAGETLKSFLTSLRFAKVLSQIQSGDYAFIQFGHNDQKKQWPQTYVEAATTYRAYLRAYIAEIRLRGATPVLVTSMQRRTFDAQGKIKNTHGDYPQAVREIAAEQGVALIDLDRLSTTLYEALGPESAPLAFSASGQDPTHHNNYGAYELAQCIAQGIRDAKLPLADALAADFHDFNPAQPDNPATFNFSASPLRSDVRPRGN